MAFHKHLIVMLSIVAGAFAVASCAVDASSKVADRSIQPQPRPTPAPRPIPEPRPGPTNTGDPGPGLPPVN